MAAGNPLDGAQLGAGFQFQLDYGLVLGRGFLTFRPLPLARRARRAPVPHSTEITFWRMLVTLLASAVYGRVIDVGRVKQDLPAAGALEAVLETGSWRGTSGGGPVRFTQHYGDEAGARHAWR